MVLSYHRHFLEYLDLGLRFQSLVLLRNTLEGLKRGDGLTYRINEQALPWRGQAEVKDSEYRDCGIMASSKGGNRTRVRDR